MTEIAVRTPDRHRARTLLIALLLLVVVHPVAHGQDATSTRRDGWIVGPLVGLPGVGSEYELSLATLGIGVTRFAPNRPGLDFAIGTVPRVIAEGLFPVAARVGPSLPVSLTPDAFLIPSVGLSGIGAVGGGGAAGAAGVYGGIAGVVARGSVGFRAGITWHRLSVTEGSLWLIEVGVMHVPTSRPNNE